MIEIQKYNRIIVANWKLNGSTSFLSEFLRNLELVKKPNNNSLTVICPPFPFINQILKKGFLVGAQDCSMYAQGAYTGETSTKILKDIFCKFCVIGHSERRNLFGDTDEIISQKAIRCLEEKIIPILCIGESLEQKNNKETKKVLINQIARCIPKEASKHNLILAYEPLWAIGTGHTPTQKEISEIHAFIKKEIPQSEDFQLLYGGSVKSNNSKEILCIDGVDGLLVGGASLDVNEFNKILLS